MCLQAVKIATGESWAINRHTTRCSSRDTGIRCSVVGPFLWPARRPGTRYQTTCEIRHVPLTVFRRDLKTSLVPSAIEALQ